MSGGWVVHEKQNKADVHDGLFRFGISAQVLPTSPTSLRRELVGRAFLRHRAATHEAHEGWADAR